MLHYYDGDISLNYDRMENTEKAANYTAKRDKLREAIRCVRL